MEYRKNNIVGIIPRPNFIRFFYRNLGALSSGAGFSRLSTMGYGFTLSQDPVHTGYTSYVRSFLQQRCHDLFWGAVCKSFTGNHGKQCIPLLKRKCPFAIRMATAFAFVSQPLAPPVLDSPGSDTEKFARRFLSHSQGFCFTYKTKNLLTFRLGIQLSPSS